MYGQYLMGNVEVAEVLLYVHRKRRLLGTGAQDSHLDFHTAPELWGNVIQQVASKLLRCSPWNRVRGPLTMLGKKRFYNSETEQGPEPSCKTNTRGS